MYLPESESSNTVYVGYLAMVCLVDLWSILVNEI
jgi:hypothetical protein